MTIQNPTRLPGDPIPPPPQPYPWKVGVSMVGLVVLVVAVVWLAFQALKGPPTAGEFPSPATATAIAQAFLATVSAADTAQPRPSATPRPATPRPAVQPTPAPTGASAPTHGPAPQAIPASTTQPATTEPPAAAATMASTPAVVGAATSVPTLANPPQSGDAQSLPARTATGVAVGAGDSTVPTPWPTVAPELEGQVSAAYARYWQVLADAFYLDDPSALDQVADGEQLVALRKNIEEDQAAGRATRVRVQHNFIVASAHDDQAEVDDQLQDSSVFINPTTHEPLASEVEPSSAEAAPNFDSKFQLQLLDGTWKVVRAARIGSAS